MVGKKNKKDINYYLNLPWTYTIETGIENGKIMYIVHLNEIHGISTDAPTINEAMRLIKEVMRTAFEMYLEDNEEIPEPIKEEDYRGKIAYRTTAKRHFLIAKEAKKRDLSLSQIIDQFIDQSLSKKI